MAEIRDRKSDMVPAIDSGSGLVYMFVLPEMGEGKKGT